MRILLSLGSMCQRSRLKLRLYHRASSCRALPWQLGMLCPCPGTFPGTRCAIASTSSETPNLSYCFPILCHHSPQRLSCPEFSIRGSWCLSSRSQITQLCAFLQSLLWLDITIAIGPSWPEALHRRFPAETQTWDNQKPWFKLLLSTLRLFCTKSIHCVPSVLSQCCYCGCHNQLGFNVLFLLCFTTQTSESLRHCECAILSFSEITLLPSSQRSSTPASWIPSHGATRNGAFL